MPVHPLFPQPIYFSNLERSLTKEELKTVNEYRKEVFENEGNTVSKNKYVLENKTLKNLKEDLNKKVIDYFNKVVCTSNTINPYITQSWLNYTENNQFHHSHSHPNSYVSGVFYVDAQKEIDTITFHKPGQHGDASYTDLKLDVDKYNIFNTTAWVCPVETGNVVLFPSFLHHGVDKKKGTNTRISLSFNSFFKGTIGNTENLTELII
jgi:uncharacterized protein (TIGR02466 family)